MDAIDLLFLLAPLLPGISIYLIVRHGPFRSRWWRGENPIGFALFVGGVAFALGFFGPMILAPGANQGPLLGIIYTGPLGLVLGLIWGLARALRRRAEPGRPAERPKDRPATHQKTHR